MGIIEAACPYCGAKTNVTASESGDFMGVYKDPNDTDVYWTLTDAGCPECDAEFYGAFD